MDKKYVADLIDEFAAEVNNGGLDQYFFNSSGDHTAETIQALKLIGADTTAAILQSCASKFPGGMPSANRTERQAQLLQVSPDDDQFDSEDEAFYEYKDDIEGLLTAFTARS